MFFIILIQFAWSLTISDFLSLTPYQIQGLSLDTLQQYFMNGSLGGYLSVQECGDLMNKLVNSFPKYAAFDDFGYTNQGVKLHTIKITATKSPKYQIVIYGMLHGTADLISVNYLLLQTYQIVIALSKADTYMTTLLVDKALWITPAINVDTLSYISSWFHTFSSLPTIYKNRNTVSTNSCSALDIGVDLQRNFQYKFGQNELGSSSDPCSQQYRGKHAFSEKETQMLDKMISEIRPDIVIGLGGDSNYVVIPETDITTYNELLFKISSKYYLNMGTYKGLYSSEINGDLCQNYIYTINNVCFTINIGSSTINNTILNYQYLLTDFFQRYSSSLKISLFKSFDCSKSKSLCKQLSSNQKGYLIIISVTNVGYIQFNDNIVMNIILNQGGEKLYQIDQYQISSTLNYSDPALETGISIDELSTDQVYRYQITSTRRLTQNQTVYFIFLMDQFGFSYDYINTVDSMNLTFTLSNTLLNTQVFLDLTPSDLKSKIRNENLESVFPNRPESYILLICFAGVSVLFFFSWIIRKCYICIYDPKRFHDEINSKSGGSSDEKHIDNYYPHNLVESRLNTQVKLSQIAPFQSMRINETPPLSKGGSGQDFVLQDEPKQAEHIKHIDPKEIENRVQKALEILKQQDEQQEQLQENQVNQEQEQPKEEIKESDKQVTETDDKQKNDDNELVQFNDDD